MASESNVRNNGPPLPLTTGKGHRAARVLEGFPGPDRKSLKAAVTSSRNLIPSSAALTFAFLNNESGISNVVFTYPYSHKTIFPSIKNRCRESARANQFLSRGPGPRGRGLSKQLNP